MYFTSLQFISTNLTIFIGFSFPWVSPLLIKFLGLFNDSLIFFTVFQFCFDNLHINLILKMMDNGNQKTYQMFPHLYIHIFSFVISFKNFSRSLMKIFCIKLLVILLVLLLVHVLKFYLNVLLGMICFESYEELFPLRQLIIISCLKKTFYQVFLYLCLGSAFSIDKYPLCKSIKVVDTHQNYILFSHFDLLFRSSF